MELLSFLDPSITKKIKIKNIMHFKTLISCSMNFTEMCRIFWSNLGLFCCLHYVPLLDMASKNGIKNVVLWCIPYKFSAVRAIVTKLKPILFLSNGQIDWNRIISNQTKLT